MYLQNVLQGLILSATVASAFNPYVPKGTNGAMRAGGSQDWSGWKPVKEALEERGAEPFVPVSQHYGDVKALGSSKWTPVVPRNGKSATPSLKMKKLVRSNTGLHPEIRHIQQANTITRKYRRRGIGGPEIDGSLAIRNAVESIEKRGLLVKRQDDAIVRSKEPSTPDSLAVHQDGHDFCMYSHNFLFDPTSSNERLL